MSGEWVIFKMSEIHIGLVRFVPANSRCLIMADGWSEMRQDRPATKKLEPRSHCDKSNSYAAVTPLSPCTPPRTRPPPTSPPPS